MFFTLKLLPKPTAANLFYGNRNSFSNYVFCRTVTHTKQMQAQPLWRRQKPCGWSYLSFQYLHSPPAASEENENGAQLLQGSPGLHWFSSIIINSSSFHTHKLYGQHASKTLPNNWRAPRTRMKNTDLELF